MRTMSGVTRRRVALVPVVVAAVFVAAAVGSASASPSPELLAPPPAPEPSAPPEPPSGGVVVEMESYIRDLGKIKKISPADARRAVDDSKSILDFKSTHMKNKKFGAIWVEYTNGYSVHVRYVDSSFEPSVDRLEKALGAPVTRHSGGAVALQMESARKLLTDRPVGFEWSLNTSSGTVDVKSEKDAKELRNIIDSSLVRVVEAPAEPLSDQPVTDQSNAGGDAWKWNGTSWNRVCTAGFMYGSTSGTNGRGFATAAHCPNMGSKTGYVSASLGLYTRPATSTFNGLWIAGPRWGARVFV